MLAFMLRAVIALCLCLQLGCARSAADRVEVLDSGFHALDAAVTSPGLTEVPSGVDAGAAAMPAIDPTLLLPFGGDQALFGRDQTFAQCISSRGSDLPKVSDDLPPCEIGRTNQYELVGAKVGLRSLVEDVHEAANGWESRLHELWLLPADGGTPAATLVLGYSSHSSTGDIVKNSRSVDTAVLDGEQIVVTRRTQKPEKLRRHVAHGRLVLTSFRGQLVPNNLGPIRTLDAETEHCLRITSKPAPMTQAVPSCWGDEEGRCVAIQNTCGHALDIDGYVGTALGRYEGTRDILEVVQPCVVPTKEHILLQFDSEPRIPEGFAFWVPRCKARNVSEEVELRLGEVAPEWEVSRNGDAIIALLPTNKEARIEIQLKPERAVSTAARGRVNARVQVIGIPDAVAESLREAVESVLRQN